MKLTVDWKLNLKTKEAQAEVHKGTKQGLVDSVTDIGNDAIKLAKKVTGHNARSIRYEVGPGKPIAHKDLEGAIYSTSGYGGYQAE